jgi:hypothetical protein
MILCSYVVCCNSRVSVVVTVPLRFRLWISGEPPNRENLQEISPEPENSCVINLHSQLILAGNKT